MVAGQSSRSYFSKNSSVRARHGDALRFGAFELLDGQLQAFLDVPDHLGLEQVALGAQQRRLGERKIERAQHVEAFMGLAQVGMGFLDDGASFRKALRGLAGDGHDFRIDRRDAEIGRIGDALRLAAGARGGEERIRQHRQRQRIGGMLAAHGIEQQRDVFDIARHRPLLAEIAIDRCGYRMRDAADARPQSDDAAEARGVAQASRPCRSRAPATPCRWRAPPPRRPRSRRRSATCPRD